MGKRKRSPGCLQPLDRPRWEGTNRGSPLPAWDQVLPAPGTRNGCHPMSPRKKEHKGWRALLCQGNCAAFTQMCVFAGPAKPHGHFRRLLKLSWPGRRLSSHHPSAGLSWSGTPEMLQKLQGNTMGCLVSYAASRRDNTDRSQPGCLTGYKLLFNCSFLIAARRNWLIWDVYNSSFRKLSSLLSSPVPWGKIFPSWQALGKASSFLECFPTTQ